MIDARTLFPCLCFYLEAIKRPVARTQKGGVGLEGGIPLKRDGKGGSRQPQPHKKCLQPL